MYIKGDRQHNSHVLANEVVDVLMNKGDTQVTSKVLKSLLVLYYSWLDHERLDKQIERVKLFKSGKADTPVRVSFRGE